MTQYYRAVRVHTLAIRAAMTLQIEHRQTIRDPPVAHPPEARHSRYSAHDINPIKDDSAKLKCLPTFHQGPFEIMPGQSRDRQHYTEQKTVTAMPPNELISGLAPRSQLCAAKLTG